MATATEKQTGTFPGQYFVEDTCIDCDLCRQTAPRFFARDMIGMAGRTVVVRQPATPQEKDQCLDALRACPVEAIRKS